MTFLSSEREWYAVLTLACDPDPHVTTILLAMMLCVCCASFLGHPFSHTSSTTPFSSAVLADK